VLHQKLLADRGTARIEQLALADFVRRGELDRHLRRMRLRYRARRDALVAAVADELPDATVGGIAAGLHAAVALSPGHDEAGILAAARAERIELVGLGELTTGRPPTLLLGYAQMSEPAIRAGVGELARVITTRSRRS
jgi:GntR family transcriptional regulator/MocR family aminotransferase